MSYRHVWGELKRWEDANSAKAHGDLGQGAAGASSRTFGAKLMWAERQAQVRLARRSRRLRADLERAFAVAFDDRTAHVLTLYASHDDALAAAREYALASARTQPGTMRTGMARCIWTSVFAAAWMRSARSTRGAARWPAFTRCKTTRSQGSLAERTYKPLLRPGSTRSSALRSAPRA
jgi:putative molybdopterin biosynthesis protein